MFRSDELRPLRGRRLRDVCIEPNLVAIRIEDLEGPIAPPLQCERIADGDAVLLQTVVKGVDILYFQAACRPATTCRQVLA